MTTFANILNKFRRESFSERDKGFRFERLMQAYLKTTALYANLFEEVWLWTEFPFHDQFGGKDTGIDLVARTVDGAYWAIQCKCYAADTSIDKPDVDTFLSTSGKLFETESGTTGFVQRLWISTTNKWSSTADQTIRNQNPPVTRLNLIDLENDDVDWSSLEQGIFGVASRSKPFTIREHQQQAIDQTHAYFKIDEATGQPAHTRGKLIMACGTGKTFTSLRIAETETGGRGLVLFLVPSIALLGQTLRSWLQQALEPMMAVCICSDPQVSKQSEKNDNDTTSVVPSYQLEAYLDSLPDDSPISVMHCFCRNIRRREGMQPKHPTPDEVCLCVGNIAKQIIEYGVGRQVSKAEARQILVDCEKKGCVHQVFHYACNMDEETTAICNCDTQCCEMLGSYTRGGMQPLYMRAHAKPVIVHPENCNGCNICNHFCPTVATGFNAQTGKVFVEYQRCIGCGVCVTKCPKDVRKMVDGDRVLFCKPLKKDLVRERNVRRQPKKK